MSVKALFSEMLSLLRSTNPRENKRAVIVTVVILGIWLSAVVFTESRHEFWRDEVRALSLARAADSPLDLYLSVQYDGHPLDWYLLLYAAKSIVNSPWILPVLGVGIGFSAVALFLFLAPFPLWFKGLFIFSAVPFYEYSVMARNYGISMLLLFAIAPLYRHKEKWALLLAFLLALLANTNAHSVVFAALIAAIWAWDLFIGHKTALVPRAIISFALSMAVILSGIFLSVISFMPRENTILSPIRQTLNLQNVLEALGNSAFHPEATFDRLTPNWIPAAIVVLVFIFLILGLLQRPPLLLAAIFAEIALGILFRLVYSGFFRHQGLYLIFAVFLYWLLLEAQRNEQVRGIPQFLFRIGAYIALPILFLAGISQLRDTAWRDIRMETSSSKALGEFLETNPAYRDAILLPEPDYLIESVAYYAENEIYLPREQRFSKTVSWTTESNPSLSLEELLTTARELQAAYGRPVLIVLGHTKIDFSQPGQERYSYNKVFSWDAQSAADFSASMVQVADFHAALEDENYLVYAFRDEVNEPSIEAYRAIGLSTEKNTLYGKGFNPPTTVFMIGSEDALVRLRCLGLRRRLMLVPLGCF